MILMSMCWDCGRKYPDIDDRDTCKCGAGLIDSDDPDFVDFCSEYDSDGF